VLMIEVVEMLAKRSERIRTSSPSHVVS
jgi:hypothetical protein